MVNIFNCLAYMIGRLKNNETLQDMTQTGQRVYASVTLNKFYLKKNTTNIKF